MRSPREVLRLRACFRPLAPTFFAALCDDFFDALVPLCEDLAALAALYAANFSALVIVFALGLVVVVVVVAFSSQWICTVDKGRADLPRLVPSMLKVCGIREFLSGDYRLILFCFFQFLPAFLTQSGRQTQYMYFYGRLAHRRQFDHIHKAPPQFSLHA